MASNMMTDQSGGRLAARPTELLLQKINHRAGNDLQMIVGLLALQSRRVTSAEAKQALTDTMERVAILAAARRELGTSRRPSLATALQHVCTALRSQAEPRSISITLKVEDDSAELTPSQITTLALVVNELATNAIKHAYEDDKSGYISITQSTDGTGGVTVLVDDDGLPFPDPKNPSRDGLGLEIAKRLMAAIGGLFIPPTAGSKIFELRLPPPTI
ncbi:sensor histidine kinase [Sphingomonas sp. LR60]|uniref:sensor histidine kinase n=1 Tax=Sphingomonas sp. LR60 TaxID=3050233 RepID=UPI002FE0A381